MAINFNDTTRCSPSQPDSEIANSSSPLQSVHTQTLFQILKQGGISIVVSTYQAGKLILVRADGNNVNTHFREFQKPMGVAASRDRLAIGTSGQIWEFRNVPNVSDRIEPKGKHDACYLPRDIHFTGDIDIHEMAWVEDELWFINTRFSCLCTADKGYSFVPRWRPPFISAYDFRDRCHLNGLGIRDGKPKYVTALGETDSPAGWRNNKASGGIMIDIESDEILLRGLSMPHSPRWYDERLWVLESGKGSLSYLDPTHNKLVSVAELPGFTRGLDFWRNLAFIGLSQIRESAVFSGLPLTQSLKERICGVWVVNILNGETVAFLKFEDAVQEIFAVSVLLGIHFPELVKDSPDLMGSSYVVPEEALSNTVTPSKDWEFAETHFAQGNDLYGQGKLEAAIASYRKCLELQPTYLPARYNLGVTLGDLEQYVAAETILKEVIGAEARHAEAYNSLGFVMSKQGKLQEAIASYEQALKILPDFAKAHYNLGMTLLKLGDFDRGWAEFEWRLQTGLFTSLNVPHPRWDGQSIPGKTLLVHTESGAGDAIQFIRYLPEVVQRCGKVILVCSPNLVPLFEGIDGLSEIFTSGDISFKTFDTYIGLMSLPYAFQTQICAIPNSIPYLRVPSDDPSDLVSLIQAQKREAVLQIGIVWSDSTTHANDWNRSVGIEDFLPVLQVPNVIFFSLQTGDRASEITQLSPEVQIVDLSGRLKTYGDTALVLGQLDLLISVDTSVAHLAGALGKPVWTILSYDSDWRWLQEREDSPWYSTMRLFRQPKPKDWESVVAQVGQELIQLHQKTYQSQ